jgi:hypothetical protein
MIGEDERPRVSRMMHEDWYDRCTPPKVEIHTDAHLRTDMSSAKRRDGTPVWIDETGSEPLRRMDLRTAEGGYDEAWLQGLIHSHPSALPLGQIEPGFGTGN